MEVARPSLLASMRSPSIFSGTKRLRHKVNIRGVTSIRSATSLF
jgi:hypothetical protein